jgi:hypothetical protein
MQPGLAGWRLLVGFGSCFWQWFLVASVASSGKNLKVVNDFKVDS